MSKIDKSIGEEKTVVSGSEKRPDLSPGQMLGQYEIIKLLGRGGMGQVYLARHSMMRTTHALKLLPAEHAGRPGFVDRFRAEVRVMANLKHPGIVNVTHADVSSDGRYYLVMEFIHSGDGETPFDLEEALAASPNGRIDPSVVACLARQIADAVAFAHSHGVIHRDLKPSNILLTQKITEVGGQRSEDSTNNKYPITNNQLVKVTDFGLARLAGDEWVQSVIQASMAHQSLGDQRTVAGGGDHGSTGSSTKSILGTYEYMSPEQREGREADARSDIYALGVIFYRMLTGQRLMGFPEMPSQVVEGLDPVWDAIIVKCLKVNPADRFQRVVEMAAALPAGSLSFEALAKRDGQTVEDRHPTKKNVPEKDPSVSVIARSDEYRDQKPEEKGVSLDHKVFFVVCVLCVLFLVLMLIFIGSLFDYSHKGSWSILMLFFCSLIWIMLKIIRKNRWGRTERNRKNISDN